MSKAASCLVVTTLNCLSINTLTYLTGNAIKKGHSLEPQTVWILERQKGKINGTGQSVQVKGRARPTLTDAVKP